MSNNKQQRYEQWAEQAVMYPFPYFAHEPVASRPESPLIPPSPAHLKDKQKENQDEFSSLLTHIKSLNLKQKEVNLIVSEAAKISRDPTPYPSPLPNGKLKINELRLMDEGFIEECGQPGILSPGNPLHKNTVFSLSPLTSMKQSPNPPSIILETVENPTIDKINGKSKLKHKPPPILMYTQDSMRSSVSSNMDASVTFSTQSRSGRTFGSQNSTPSHIDDITTSDDEGMVSDISEDIDDLTLAEILSMGKEGSATKLDALRNLPLDNRISWNSLKNSPRLKHVLQLIPGAQTPPSLRQSPMKSPYPPSLSMSMDDMVDMESSKLKEELDLNEKPLNELDTLNSEIKEELLKAIKLFNKSSLNHIELKEYDKSSDLNSFMLNEELLKAIKHFNKSSLNHIELKEPGNSFKFNNELLKAIRLFSKSDLNHVETEESSNSFKLNKELLKAIKLFSISSLNHVEPEEAGNSFKLNMELLKAIKLFSKSNLNHVEPEESGNSFKLKKDLLTAIKHFNKSNLNHIDPEETGNEFKLKEDLLRAIKFFNKSNLNHVELDDRLELNINEDIDEDLNLSDIVNSKLNKGLLQAESLLNRSPINEDKLKTLKLELLEAIKLFNKSNLNHLEISPDQDIDEELPVAQEMDRELLVKDDDRFKRRLTRLHYELSFHKPHSILYGALLNPRMFMRKSTSVLYTLFKSPTFTFVMLAVVMSSQFNYFKLSLDNLKQLLS